MSLRAPRSQPPLCDVVFLQAHVRIRIDAEIFPPQPPPSIVVFRARSRETEQLEIFRRTASVRCRLSAKGVDSAPRPYDMGTTAFNGRRKYLPRNRLSSPIKWRQSSPSSPPTELSSSTRGEGRRSRSRGRDQAPRPASAGTLRAEAVDAESRSGRHVEFAANCRPGQPARPAPSPCASALPRTPPIAGGRRAETEPRRPRLASRCPTPSVALPQSPFPFISLSYCSRRPLATVPRPARTPPPLASPVPCTLLCFFLLYLPLSSTSLLSLPEEIG